MNSPRSLRASAVGMAAAIAAAFAGDALAQATTLLPNLIALPASSFSLVTNAQAGTTTLRFATTSWNSGAGPLELVAGPTDTGSGKQQVYQRIYLSNGSYTDNFAGWFTWHPQHQHIHFDDYALYTLQPVNAPGGSVRTGSKMTFCVMDTTKVDTSLPGAPGSAVYTTCGAQRQGMSVGWGDTYGASLAGQEIDFTGNADGIYALKIDVDPKKLLLETNENDNLSCVLLSLRKPSTVTVLDASGACSAVASITPNSASMGTTVQVTITGYGLGAADAVSFEGGNGPRPVASNVQLISDTDTLDTISATVSIPVKKQLGKNPVWDLRVGNGGVLRDAFTVTR